MPIGIIFSNSKQKPWKGDIGTHQYIGTPKGRIMSSTCILNISEKCSLSLYVTYQKYIVQLQGQSLNMNNSLIQRISSVIIMFCFLISSRNIKQLFMVTSKSDYLVFFCLKNGALLRLSYLKVKILQFYMTVQFTMYR